MVHPVEVRKLAEPPYFRFHTVGFHKNIQWAWAVWEQFKSSAFKAFLAWAGGAIVALIGLYLLHQPETSFLRTDGAIDAIATTAAGFIWLGMVFLATSIWSLLTARSRVAARGHWHGTRIIFREPVYIATVMAEAADSGRKLRVSVDAAPRFSVVRCQVENPLNSHLLKAIAHSPYYVLINWENLIANKPWPSFAKGPLNFGVRVGSEREFYLEWNLPQNALAHEMRIRIFSFEIQDSRETDGYKFFHWHVSQQTNDFDAYGR
jgi:hypothetical protein